MPDDNNLWTAEQQAKIISWTAAKWKPNTQCAQCGVSNWMVGPSPAHIILGTRDGATILGSSYPCAIILCRNCGNMVFVNTFLAGITAPQKPEVEKGASNGCAVPSAIQPVSQHDPLVITEISTRRMKTYVVTDSEMTNLSLMNGAATLFFSAASFFASTATGLWQNIFVADSPSQIAVKFGDTIQRSCWFVAGFFVCLAVISLVKRRSLIALIKREGGERSPDGWRRKLGRFICGPGA